jgi:hypothetical protein
MQYWHRFAIGARIVLGMDYNRADQKARITTERTRKHGLQIRASNRELGEAKSALANPSSPKANPAGVM